MKDDVTNQIHFYSLKAKESRSPTCSVHMPGLAYQMHDWTGMRRRDKKPLCQNRLVIKLYAHATIGVVEHAILARATEPQRRRCLCTNGTGLN
jgi:hypothetical protein